MNKLEIKNILMSLRTHDNEPDVNFLLGKISMLSEEELTKYIEKIGDSQEAITTFLNDLLLKQKNSRLRENQKYPINKYFTYGLSDEIIHLHLPNKLHELIKSKRSVTKAVNTINLYLLDALNKIKNMTISNHPHINNVEKIYMISPILIQRELDFLKELDFDTIIYSNKDLKNTEFLNQNPKAQFATRLFVNDVEKGRNVGKAEISLDSILTSEWQTKSQNKIKEFNSKGIFIDESENTKQILT